MIQRLRESDSACEVAQPGHSDFFMSVEKLVTSLVVSIEARDVRRRVATTVVRIHIRALLDQ